jgi:hypothetical protein
VAGAAVYLVPAADVEKLRKEASIEIRANVDNDEPMEDTLATGRDKYRKGVTDQTGAFTISEVEGGKYFVYVEPGDPAHLPGGDMANKAMSAAKLTANLLAIQVSKVPDNAHLVGSSKCLSCHKNYADLKKTLHTIGIAVINKPSNLQDFSRFTVWSNRKARPARAFPLPVPAAGNVTNQHREPHRRQSTAKKINWQSVLYSGKRKVLSSSHRNQGEVQGLLRIAANRLWAGSSVG